MLPWIRGVRPCAFKLFIKFLSLLTYSVQDPEHLHTYLLVLVVIRNSGPLTFSCNMPGCSHYTCTAVGMGAQLP